MDRFKFFERNLPKVALTLGLGAFAVTACEEVESRQVFDPSKTAIVLSHEHHPASSWFLTGIFSPEQFHLQLIQCPTEEDYTSNKVNCVTAHVDVGPDAYTRYEDNTRIILKS